MKTIVTDLVKPSDFAALGNPNCSCFRKSEMEWMALDYVKALVLAGDEWNIRLSPKELVTLLKGDCNVVARLLAKGKCDPYMWDRVGDKLRSLDGAKEVWKMSLMRHNKKENNE